METPIAINQLCSEYSHVPKCLFILNIMNVRARLFLEPLLPLLSGPLAHGMFLTLLSVAYVLLARLSFAPRAEHS